MNAVQFLRLAEQLSTLPPDIRRVVEALAVGDHKAAATAAGGKGSDAWWAAEFFLAGLAAHGIEPQRVSRSAPPRTASLFAD
jgi:hypothetical protein